MSTRDVTDALARQITDDLRTRYDLDNEDLRALGAKLVGEAQIRRDENDAFAERFTAEHRDTFSRLAQ